LWELKFPENGRLFPWIQSDSFAYLLTGLIQAFSLF